MQNSSELLQLIFHLSPSGMAVADARGVCAMQNEAFLADLGTSRDELLGMSLWKAFEHKSQSLEQVLLDWQGSTWEGEVVFAPTRTRCRVNLSRLSGATEPGLFLFSVRSESMKVPSIGVKRDSAHFRRLESLGVLAGSIAHDLNNILTGVLGHVSYLKMTSAQGLASDSLNAIEDGARRAASMTKQILEYARGRPVEIKPVNMNHVVLSAMNLLRSTIPTNVEIEIHAQKQDVYVLAEESQLNQLVMNLAVNARDALPRGGVITLTIDLVRVQKREHARVGRLSIDPGNYAKLCIRDNGVGMPSEVCEKIFEPFFTTKTTKGTGLGLATVHTIVEQHQGLIDVETSEGKGTNFVLYLPATFPAERTESSAQDKLVPTGKEKILVVDDEEAVRTVIQRCLEHLGYDVQVACDGQEALQLYTARCAFRLVILDMMMPNMAGDEVFERLKEIDMNVPVLIASGYSSDSRAKRILEQGGLGYIQKPFAVEELAREVRRCIDNHAHGPVGK